MLVDVDLQSPPVLYTFVMYRREDSDGPWSISSKHERLHAGWEMSSDVVEGDKGKL